MYLAFHIGCIECGESSAVIGLYATEDEAQAACEKARVKQEQHWTGQHSMKVFPVEAPLHA